MIDYNDLVEQMKRLRESMGVEDVTEAILLESIDQNSINEPMDDLSEKRKDIQEIIHTVGEIDDRILVLSYLLGLEIKKHMTVSTFRYVQHKNDSELIGDVLGTFAGAMYSMMTLIWDDDETIRTVLEIISDFSQFKELASQMEVDKEKWK